jgi:hypothetical protein
MASSISSKGPTAKPASTPAKQPGKSLTAMARTVRTSPHSQPAQKPVVDASADEPPRRSRTLHNFLSWATSCVFHFAMILVLALWVLDGPRGPSGTVDVDLLASAESPTDQMEEASPLTQFEAPSEMTTEQLTEAVSDESLSDAMAESLSQMSVAEGAATSDAASAAIQTQIASIDGKALLQDWSEAPSSKSGPKAPPRRSAADGVRAAESVDGAADGVLASLRGDMEEGDVFMVWLLDASISLFEDRQTLAAKLAPFYAEISDPNRSGNRLNSAVVAYGSYPLEVAKSTKFTVHTLNAVRNMPIDSSGAENVCTAIDFCVRKYAKKARGRLRIVVWTDESGDDLPLLEQTIKACRRIHASVHVVGPSSVLGSNRGLQNYTDKASGYKFLLPVTRGPDSCLPERVMLPYWFDTSSSAGQYAGGTIADGMPWYGGALRERLLSGLGPYGLTRLALETGGTFTLLDRPEDRSPFSLESLKAYFPDYGNADEVMESIQKSPLRKATWQAVMKTYQPVNLAPPKFSFYNWRQPRYPYAEQGPSYRPPAEFRRLLVEDLPKQVLHVMAASQVIEDALTCFKGNDSPSEYDMEESPRWRAWYDLTHGRLLAMSIRHREYAAACKWMVMPGNLKPETNYVTFQASSDLFTDDTELQRRKEIALKLLSRCRDDNPGTPWELLAQWELEYNLGIQPVQHVIPVPQPSPPVNLPPEPKIVLPNL